MYLLEAIEKELPGIEIFITCKFSHLKEYFKTDRIITDPMQGIVIDPKKDFCYFHQLKCNMVDHPVEKMIEDSELTLKHLVYPEIKTTTKRCVISPKAMLPAKSLTNDEIEYAKRLALNSGYDPIVDTSITGAGWVIAPENETLFLAAANGMRTTLVPNGIGTNFYKRIFPNGEIM